MATAVRRAGPVTSSHNQNTTVAVRAMADKKTFGAAVITGSDTSPVFEPAEHPFDAVARLYRCLS